MNINFLALRVPSVRKTLEFYSHHLDLPLLLRGEGFAVFRAGSTVLMFQEVDDAYEKPFYHFAFDIPRNKLDQAEAWLSERVTLLKRDGETQVRFEEWNASSLYFLDPSGNIVEFIARRDLENDSDAPFSGGGVLRVSEIGWPCMMGIPDRDFQLPLWKEYEGFKAFGSETGLILVVDTLRTWTPTDRKAEAHPCTMVISDEKGSREYFRR